MVVESYERVSQYEQDVILRRGTVKTNRRHLAGLLDMTCCNCKDCGRAIN